MASILAQYYRGITHQLRAEVDFINSIFNHQGIKGDGNEIILRELIKKFIPKKYGVGTGVVIDRKGNQSKQIDIIIYDKMLYPSILSISSVHLFPVDIVYATIEVKTTLNSAEAIKAKENIASVRSLELIPDTFQIGTSSQTGFIIIPHKPTPPLGAIFSYNSDAQAFETNKNWFVPNSDDFKKYPSIVGCLDQGIIFIDVAFGKPIKANAITLRYGDDRCATINKEVDEFVFEGINYPVKTVKGERILIDQSRVLLLFVIYFTELLVEKPINPSIKFSEHYLDFYDTFRVEV